MSAFSHPEAVRPIAARTMERELTSTTTLSTAALAEMSAPPAKNAPPASAAREVEYLLVLWNGEQPDV